MPDAVIPLFPLGTVLYPGLLLPLQVFEPRYRTLITDLAQLPEQDRAFGVIAIRQGREVGSGNFTALHEVGCLALIRRIDPTKDGRFRIVTTGERAFRLNRVISDDAKPYLRAEVTWLDETDSRGQLDTTQLQQRFLDYLSALGSAKGLAFEPPPAQEDPVVLSYLIAATMLVDLSEKQRLLEETRTSDRIARLLMLLRRETTLLTHLPSAPATDLGSIPICLN